jgi:homoserine kinase type II
MAVYTPVDDGALKAFLAEYDIGTPLSFKGIAEGIENSNFLLLTERGRFILTLYEKRVTAADLPFFLGLMEHLAARGLACPLPVKRRDGSAISTLCARPAAIVTFLEGLAATHPGAEQCRAAGAALARLHSAGADYGRKRPNALGPAGWPALQSTLGVRGDQVMAGLGELIASEIATLEAAWPRALPAGVVHADLFPDNVFFLGGAVSGLIDFYFACDDILAYDLAVMLNAWCFDERHLFVPERASALAAGYESLRVLTAAERVALPVLARGAALRFLLTRTIDWLETPKDALVAPKDPREYLSKLRFHKSIASITGYGLDR